MLSTGFVVGGSSDLSEKIEAPLTGRNGVSFTTAWEKPGSMTAFGVFLPGFPNFAATFYRGGGFSYNLSSVYDVFARPLCACSKVVETAHRQKNNRHKLVLDVSEKAVDRWADEVAKRATWISPLGVCTPGYYNDEGVNIQQRGAYKCRRG